MANEIFFINDRDRGWVLKGTYWDDFGVQVVMRAPTKTTHL